MKKVKAVKAWGTITSTGRLRNYASRYRRQVAADPNFGDKFVPVWIMPVSGYAPPQPLPKPRARGKVEYWVLVYAKSPKWYWKADHATGSVTCHDKGKPDGFAVAATPSECGGPDDKQITLSQVRAIRKSWQPTPATLPKSGKKGRAK